MMFLSGQTHRSNTVQHFNNLFRAFKNPFLCFPNFLLNTFFSFYLLIFKSKFIKYIIQYILILFPLLQLITNSPYPPKLTFFLSKTNKPQQKLQKHTHFMESVSCWLTAPKDKPCLRMWLIHPVSFH